MFERYTETARCVIFFARYEASAHGSPIIDTEHLLLGILREDKNLVNQLAPAGSAESIWAMVGEPGVGRTNLVQGLARAIANGTAPECLLDKRVLSLNPRMVIAACGNAATLRSGSSRFWMSSERMQT